MAGQSQEPWQSYSPPSADNHDTYTFPPPGAQGAPGAQSAPGALGYGQAAARPAPGYHVPPYGVQDPAVGYQDQPAGYQDPTAGYPSPQGQEAPPWHEAQARSGAPAAPMARSLGDSKGFFGALFDFGFNSFVTPKIIKALYVLYTIWVVVWAIIFLRLGFKYGGTTGGIFTLIVVDPIFLLLTLGVYRVVLELFMVIHRMHDDLRAIRSRTEERS